MILAKKFEHYIEQFTFDHQLFPADKKFVLALSGGVDSMALFYILLSIREKNAHFNFEVVHFNHGVRAESHEEAQAIRHLCDHYQINLSVMEFHLNGELSNFEQVARLKRQTIYQQYIKSNFYVILGHHIDDSFEWSLLQKFRQGQDEKTIGIPIFSRGIVRPLMGATKAQILSYAKKKQIKWFDDQSNFDSRFDRNFLRLKIIPLIKKRYPQYLKHYVHQSNAKAFQYQSHRKIALKKKYGILMAEHFLCGYVFQSSRLDLHREEILAYIQKMSDVHRGKLNVVMDQIFRSVEAMRNDHHYKKFHGPYSFTGDVHAYLFCDRLWLTKREGIKKFIKWEDDFLDNIKKGTHIPLDGHSTFLNRNELQFFPNLTILDPSKKRRSALRESKLTLPFLKKVTDHFKKTHIPYGFISLSNKG